MNEVWVLVEATLFLQVLVFQRCTGAGKVLAVFGHLLLRPSTVRGSKLKHSSRRKTLNPKFRNDIQYLLGA